MSVGYDCPGGCCPEQDQWRVTNDNPRGSYIYDHRTVCHQSLSVSPIQDYKQPDYHFPSTVLMPTFCTYPVVRKFCDFCDFYKRSAKMSSRK